MPINPDLMHLYPGGSIRSSEWLAIRGATLVRAAYRCEFCQADDRTTIVRGDDGTFMTLKGGVFDENTGEFIRTVDILSYRGRFVDIQLTIAHLDHDPTNNSLRNLKALCRGCHLRHDTEHHRQTRRKKKAIGDLFDGLRDSKITEASG